MITTLPLKKILVISIAYMPIHIVVNKQLPNSLLITVLLPFIVAFLSLFVFKHELKAKDVWSFVIMSVIFFTLVPVYQQFSGAAKLNIIATGRHYTNIGSIARIYYSIDSFLFLILLIVMKGSVLNGRSLESLVFPQNVKSNLYDEEDSEAINEVRGMEKSERNIIFFLIFSFQIFQLLSVLFVVKIGNVFLEGLIIMFTYLASSKIIKKRWHSNSVLVCFFVTDFLFYTAAKISIPAKYSLFVPVIIGTIICYVMYRVAIYYDEINIYKEFYNKHNVFDPERATEEALRERCRLCGFNQEDTELAVTLFVIGGSSKEIANEYNKCYGTDYSDAYFRGKKYRFKMKLLELPTEAKTNENNETIT